jgi:hypothetical protein
MLDVFMLSAVKQSAMAHFIVPHFMSKRYRWAENVCMDKRSSLFWMNIRDDKNVL